MPFISVETTLTSQVKLDELPALLHDRLYATITGLTDRLLGLVKSSEPVRTGQLKGMTFEKVFEDNPNRIAGYVRILAPDGGKPKEFYYGKAAALEYGSHKSISVGETDATKRAVQSHARIKGALGAPSRAVGTKFNRTTNIAADHFLRDAMDEIRPEAAEELRAVVKEFFGE